LPFLFIGLIDSLNTSILRTCFTLQVYKSLEVPVNLREHICFFLLVAIIAPIIEEVIIRLSLVFDPLNISLSVSTLISLIINRLSFPLISLPLSY